jgi:hypothetical protein
MLFDELGLIMPMRRQHEHTRGRCGVEEQSFLAWRMQRMVNAIPSRNVMLGYNKIEMYSYKGVLAVTACGRMQYYGMFQGCYVPR